MSKFKLGDKVRRVKDLGSRFDGSISYIITGFASDGCLSLQGLDSYWDDRCFDLIIAEPWSIYNNTLPLIDLSDEQVGRLVKFRASGGTIIQAEYDVSDNDGWRAFSEKWQWVDYMAYRAKQKSERELFEEALIKVIGTELVSPLSISDILFDAGFKAPKVGE